MELRLSSHLRPGTILARARASPGASVVEDSHETVEDVIIVDDSSDEPVGFDEYFISSYGIDFDVDGIVKRYNRGDIEVPDFQRKYVWKLSQASKFVESLLMGLPVPGIFLYREDDSRKLTVIDGQQRILTLKYFYKGVFDTGRLFCLSGLASNYNGKCYKDLGHYDRRKLDDSIIHATIIRQEKPEDDGSSKYAIFERLNTGGTRLASQEIRSAIYPGAFCELLIELNKNTSWRKLFGKIPDRQRDEELILRFLALYYEFEDYRPSMTKYLNEFMKRNQTLKRQGRSEIECVFGRTVDTILEKIGDRAFKPQSGVNAAVLDSTMVGVARRLQGGAIHQPLGSRYENLLGNPDYEDAISGGTSRADKVRQRIKLAIEAFSDAK